jgi:hypothetical protein
MLEHPELLLTNDLAERPLRHWVIARRISYGTRNPQGSRAFTVLASVIETCRQRGWPFALALYCPGVTPASSRQRRSPATARRRIAGSIEAPLDRGGGV